MKLMTIEMRLVKRVQGFSQGSVMFNFLTGMKTRLCGTEIQCVQWIVLLFNNMPDVQLAKHLSEKKTLTSFREKNPKNFKWSNSNKLLLMF